MNQFQIKSLANMAFDLAKVWFGGVAAMAGGLLCVMVGLHMGKEVKDR